MSSRASVNRLFKLHGDIDRTVEELETELDDTAISLLTTLCAGLSLAAAGVRNADAGLRELARRCASDYIVAMCDVLEVWEMSDVEIVDGPALADGDDAPRLVAPGLAALGGSEDTDDDDDLDPDGDDPGDDPAGDDLDAAFDIGDDDTEDGVEPPDLGWLSARDWSAI